MSSQKASAFSLSGGRTLANSGLKRNTEALLVRHGITSSLEHLNIIRVWYTYMYVVCNLKLKLTVASWRWLWIRMVRSLAEAPGCCWLAEADGPALRARCHWSTWGHMGTPGSLYKRESGPFQINLTSYTWFMFGSRPVIPWPPTSFHLIFNSTDNLASVLWLTRSGLYHNLVISRVLHYQSM